MRASAVAAIAVVCALLGGISALAIGKATGWVDASTQTVVVPATPADSSPASQALDTGASGKPLSGNGFDPAKIYRRRAAGVVTIISLFGNHATTGQGAAAQGSGFVVSSKGYILTNSHVITTAGEGLAGGKVAAASTVFVEFRDGDREPARVVGWDVYDDVGLLKVEPGPHPLSPVPLGDSSRVRVGEAVAAIGSPFGQINSLSVGVVSATERSINSLTSSYDLVDAIQTDAPINHGNSGGPMFDARGFVIGINAQIRSNSGNAEGVGFAVPINSAKRSMEQLIADGRVRYAWLGITTQTLTPSLARHFGSGVERGAAIQAVVPGSPAEKAGLRGGSSGQVFEGISMRPGGDVVVAVDGRGVRNAEDLIRATAERLLPGQTVRLSVVRGSKRRVVSIVLGERPLNPPSFER